jgi:hypothetical protein|tara:strand:+ start:2913 stop:3449 length:537 start_codon:yes stop_codon:yes gene_type:complete
MTQQYIRNGREKFYETADHLEKEKEIVGKWCGTQGKKFVKLPIKYSLDYAILQRGTNVIDHFLEVKIRQIRSDSYTDYFISYLKYRHAQLNWDNAQKQTHLLVAFTDKAQIVRLDNILTAGDSKVVMGGTFSRNDPNDHEPMIQIPMTLFSNTRLRGYNAAPNRKTFWNQVGNPELYY